jgi:hypothetical protein
MRRPWIKIEICTPDKPEICSLATQLKMDDDAVVGKLVRLWSWAELNRINPNDLGVTKEFIDKLVGRKGFAQALEKTGWLIETEEKLSFRNFKRHNSPVAQNKALTAKRVARHRLRKAAAEEKVTNKPLPASIEPPVAETTRAIASVKEKKSTRREKLTVKPLPEPVVEAPKIEEISVSTDNVSNVITQDSSLVINEKTTVIDQPESVEPEVPLAEPSGNAEPEAILPHPSKSVEPEAPLPEPPKNAEPEAPLPEAPVTIEKPEEPSQITPQEALAVLQLEEPAPKKRRGKAAPDTTDQPMLF